MSPNRQPDGQPDGHVGGASYAAPAGVGAMVHGDLDVPAGFWFDWHRHPQHQIAWTPSAVLAVNVDDAHWVLPPSRALWLPADVVHRTGVTSGSRLRGIYVEPARCPIEWTMPTMLAVSPLLRELFEYLAETRIDADERARAEGVVFDLIRPVEVVPVGAPMPTDPRARSVAATLTADPGDQRTLAELAAMSGASARTVARAFHRETGMGFERWRTQIRLRASLPLLARAVPLEGVANRVGYASPSAFVAAFRREVGVSPGRYFAETVRPMP